MDNTVAGPGMLSLSLRPLNEDSQQLACRWRGCQDGNRLFCPQSLYDHLCQAHASSSYAALGLAQDLSVGNGSAVDGDGKTGDIGEGVACLWEGCQYRCKSKKRHHMNSHLRSHVPLSPFQCHICAVTFKWKSDLTKHLRRQHDITGPAANQAMSAEDNALETGSMMSDEMDFASVPSMGMQEDVRYDPLFSQQLQANMAAVAAAAVAANNNNGMSINGQHGNEMDAAQLQASRERSISVLQHFIQVVREGRLQPHSNDPALAVWSEELSKLDLATIKPLLASNPDALQIIESFLDVMNVESGHVAVKNEMSTSPQPVPMMDSMSFLGHNNVSPSVPSNDKSITSSPAIMAADGFNGGVPLTNPLSSMGGLFAMDQTQSMYSAGVTYPAVTATNDPAGIAAAAAVAAMTNAAHPAIFSPPAQHAPFSLLQSHQNSQQATPSPHMSSMSPPIDESLLFGSSIDSSSFVYSPPAKIDEEPVSSPGAPLMDAQMAAASQLDVAQYNWLLNQEYPMGIESAMGVQPSEIFGAMSPTNMVAQQMANNPQAHMFNWTNQLRHTNGADERSLRRVQSTPMLVEHAQQRPTIRSPGSPSMLRPMRSTELRARMVSPSRSTERATRPTQHATKASMLRASQSVDALRMHAAVAAAAAAANPNPTIPEHGNAPDFSANPAAIGMVGVNNPVNPAIQMDKRGSGRGRLDTVLRRMQQLTLRNPTGVTGQVKFKRSLERIRWQGQ
ncbi:hypothetical protein BDF19DRAFT_413890 [Syncephalis fuscata]|nr:hypothetical protein BDF19DRAFT_413890 [Syncephalis fuscata]